MLRYLRILFYATVMLLLLPLLQTQGVRASLPHDGKAGDCLSNSLDNSIYCRGTRAMRNIIKNLNKSEKPLVLIRGLEIVPSKDNDKMPMPSTETGTGTADASAAHNQTAGNGIDDGAADESFLALFAAYLRTHELNLKFSDLLADESERFLAQDLDRNGAKVGSEEARKKDKGQGIMLAMVLMFGKMMAVMGLGGIGALALKALGVAMAALMMAGLVGLKSLAQHGHENSHSISYLTSEGHHHKRRRRRSAPSEVYDPLPLVYAAWPKAERII